MPGGAKGRSGEAGPLSATWDRDARDVDVRVCGLLGSELIGSDET
jgi:hypothetical protein